MQFVTSHHLLLYNNNNTIGGGNDIITNVPRVLPSPYNNHVYRIWIWHVLCIVTTVPVFISLFLFVKLNLIFLLGDFIIIIIRHVFFFSPLQQLLACCCHGWMIYRQTASIVFWLLKCCSDSFEDRPQHICWFFFRGFCLNSLIHGKLWNCCWWFGWEGMCRPCKAALRLCIWTYSRWRERKRKEPSISSHLFSLYPLLFSQQ